jgi:phosphatidylethanolamine N-methyltransferase
MGPGYSYEDTPDEFNAWLCYRVLVDFVLANDVSAYMVFVLKVGVYDTRSLFD